MTLFAKTNVPATALAAFITGLALSPYGFIAIGALFHFSPAFSFVFLPPLILGSVFLLWRYVSKPNDNTKKPLSPLLEAANWIAVGVFVFFVSNFKL